MTENRQRAEQAALLPLGPLPHVQHHTEPTWAAPLCNWATETKKKMAQIKEQIKAPEKIQLSNEEIANLSDAQFKTLVTRMVNRIG